MNGKRLFNTLLFLSILATVSIGSAQAQPHPQTGDKDRVIHITSGADVKYTENLVPGWETVSFDDSTWLGVSAPSGGLCDPDTVSHIPESQALPIWGLSPQQHQTIYVRKTFTLDPMQSATIQTLVDDDFDLYVNGILVRSDWNGIWSYYEDDISALIQPGVNVIAIKAGDTCGGCQHLAFDVTVEKYKHQRDGSRGPQYDETATWTVCQSDKAACDFQKIQDAVDHASEGDLIRIARGIYNIEDDSQDEIVYLNKNITLRGGFDDNFSKPPDYQKHPTILDARGQGRVIFIHNSSPTIEGLTITGGDATGLGGTPYGDSAGGGIYIYSGSPTIRNNIIRNNYSPWDGGGIYMRYSSSAVLMENTVTNNRSKYGGGVYIWYSTLSVQDNLIMDNEVTGTGGGIWMGVYSEATFFGNIISGNIAQEDYAPNGGGMRAERSKLLFENNIVKNNETYAGGGGISIDRTSATIVNNLFVDNLTHTTGGGLYLEGSSAQIMHNTFARNSGMEASGIYVNFDEAGRISNAVMTNNIIVGHNTGVMVSSGNSASINGTLWGTGEWENGVDWDGEGTIESGNINIWGDPAFLDPDTQDYHLTWQSPAINAGLVTEITNDIDGDHRPFGSKPDLGFDEWMPSSELGSFLIFNVGTDEYLSIFLPALSR